MQGNKTAYIKMTIRELEIIAAEYYERVAYFRGRLSEGGGSLDRKVNRDLEQYYTGALAAVDYIKRSLQDDLNFVSEYESDTTG